MNKKIIYQFTVNTEQDVEEEKTSKRKNKETGEMETVTTTKTVKKSVLLKSLYTNLQGGRLKMPTWSTVLK